MKLSREVFQPFIRKGNPKEVIDNLEFLRTLQNATVCYGCTEERLTVEELMTFFGKDTFFNLCAKNNRFDILTNKNLECEFLQSGQYLEEIYHSIKTQTPEWLRNTFLARFSNCGQTKFLQEKEEWAAIAKSQNDWTLLLQTPQLSVFLLTDKTFVHVKKDKASYLEPNLDMFEKVYQRHGAFVFTIAIDIADEKGYFGVVNALQNFLQEKGKNIY